MEIPYVTLLLASHRCGLRKGPLGKSLREISMKFTDRRECNCIFQVPFLARDPLISSDTQFALPSLLTRARYVCFFNVPRVSLFPAPVLLFVLGCVHAYARARKFASMWLVELRYYGVLDLPLDIWHFVETVSFVGFANCPRFFQTSLGKISHREWRRIPVTRSKLKI